MENYKTAEQTAKEYIGSVESEIKSNSELEDIVSSFSDGLLRNENLIREIYTKVSRIKSFPPRSDEKARDTTLNLGIVSDMWELREQMYQNNSSLQFILE